MVEIKDSAHSSISSFNSTYPTGEKSVVDLEMLTHQTKRTIRNSLERIEENPAFEENRDVYYLIRTNRGGENPIVSLVRGDYFGESESSAIAENPKKILDEIESEDISSP